MKQGDARYQTFGSTMHCSPLIWICEHTLYFGGAFLLCCSVASRSTQNCSVLRHLLGCMLDFILLWCDLLRTFMTVHTSRFQEGPASQASERLQDKKRRSWGSNPLNLPHIRVDSPHTTEIQGTESAETRTASSSSEKKWAVQSNWSEQKRCTTLNAAT